jgi:UDP-N-acetylmuramate dehydrogenase
MNMQQNISLKKYNTFGIDVTAKYFANFTSLTELAALLTEQTFPILILGGGSNILFTKNYNGLVLKNELKGISKINEDDKYVYVQAAAGENWHEFVMYCIDNDWAGVENLSLIPGCVGASPMQNIGAYGVELKDIFHSLEAYHKKENKLVTFTLQDCEFGYRESIFKNKYKNEFTITSVTFKLSKTPTFNITYGAIEQELTRMGVKQLSIKAISNAVINIRKSKLPNPFVIGNAGSFFKNPEVKNEQFLKLKENFENIIGYPQSNGNTKIAAGWLIEQCGFKGKRFGDAGCHAQQALVLVNYGNANGNQIFELSDRIIVSVGQKFGIALQREVNII